MKKLILFLFYFSFSINSIVAQSKEKPILSNRADSLNPNYAIEFYA